VRVCLESDFRAFYFSIFDAIQVKPRNLRKLCTKLKFYPMKMLRNLLWVVLSTRLLTWAVNVETRGSAALRCETAIPEWYRFYIKKRDNQRMTETLQKSTKNHMEWVRMCQMDNSLALSQFWFFFFTSRPELTELCFWSLERKCKQIFKKKR
jgi:hypothetical protein